MFQGNVLLLTGLLEARLQLLLHMTLLEVQGIVLLLTRQSIMWYYRIIFWEYTSVRLKDSSHFEATENVTHAKCPRVNCPQHFCNAVYIKCFPYIVQMASIWGAVVIKSLELPLCCEVKRLLFVWCLWRKRYHHSYNSRCTVNCFITSGNIRWGFCCFNSTMKIRCPVITR